ncbi:MAG: pyridoxamine 5'-phosphate oxidase [Bacteroidales bacterium]
MRSKSAQALFDLRVNYTKARLNKENVHPNPVTQFQQWFDAALESKVNEANAMTLSTIKGEGIAASRVVLLKKIRSDGFVFFTNYDSDKARELDQNPGCSLVFLWHELERQVRIEGYASKISAEESDEYFLSRPRESRLGAWASPQSREIQDRIILEQKAEELQKNFEGKTVPRPSFWGGYIARPTMVEFWQGRPGRLHDRIRYTRKENQWRISRLAP